MRNWAMICGILVTIPCSVRAAEKGWQENYADASKMAAEKHLPLVLHFGAWYCGPCQQMEKTVFSDPEVQDALIRGVIAIKIDVSQEAELAQKYGASSVPRDVVVFQDGTVETLNVGRMSRPNYIALLRSVAHRGAGMTRPIPEGDPASGAVPVIARSNSDSTPGPAAPDTTTVPPLLGLEGFCPVRLKKNREWISGNSAMKSEYRGILYYFASETERDEFIQSPSIYAPEDLGCDPVVLTEDQKAVAGSIRFGAFFDGRLYLFTNTENREEFKLNPLKFTRVRSALKADQIVGTRFQ